MHPDHRLKHQKTQIQKQEQITTYVDANLHKMTNFRVAKPVHLFLATPAAILATLCSASKSSFPAVVMAKRRFWCTLGTSVNRFDRRMSPRGQNRCAKSPSMAAICGLRSQFARKGRSQDPVNRDGVRLQAHARPRGRIRAAWPAGCAPIPRWQ